MSAVRALRLFRTSTACGSRTLFSSRQSSNAVWQSLRYARPTPIGVSRAFSVTACKFSEGSTDVALSDKLKQELAYELESTDSKAVPAFLKQFQSAGQWQIEDTPGHDEVVLTRKFGNEDLRLVFSISDIQANPEEELEDEMEQEAREEETKEEDGEEQEPVLHSFPIRTSLTITKSNAAEAIMVDMMCQEGNFIIENISFYRDGKLATALTADADWTRRGSYIGPQFESLDVSLQEQFEAYLQERGINETVALFIPEFAEYKEQTEYVEWLKGVKKFVDA